MLIAHDALGAHAEVRLAIEDGGRAEATMRTGLLLRRGPLAQQLYGVPIVADGLATVGELLRSDQLRPEAEAEAEGEGT
jgi:hypothetical protein